MLIGPTLYRKCLNKPSKTILTDTQTMIYL